MAVLHVAELEVGRLMQASPGPEIPRGSLPSFAQLFSEGMSVPAVALATLGDVLWLVAYALILIKGFKDRTYGIPLVAICLNFTWEFWFAVVEPPASRIAHITHFLWLLLDIAIVYQLVRWGRKEQTIPEIKKYFDPVLAVTMLLALIGQVTLNRQLAHNTMFPDAEGSGIAWLINFVMGVLFIFLYFGRRDLRGLSYGGAWAMMIGTLLVALGNVLVFTSNPHVNYELQMRRVGEEAWQSAGIAGSDTVHLHFYYFLFVSLFLVNGLYVYLLHRARRERASESS